LVQVASPPAEPVEARRDRVGALVVDGARGADLVVLPELWAPGYFAFDHYAERAEPLNGPTAGAACAWARELGAYIHLGSLLERAADGRLHNTAVLLDPDGRVMHTYRKIHVFGYQSREAMLLTPGHDARVVPTPFGRLGATACYDLRFPELWRGLVDAGAEVVVTPSAWPAARREHWRLFTTCRAVEEQIIVIACNGVGEQDGGVLLAGHSRVVDPWGAVLAEAGTDEGVTLVTVDASVVNRTRAEFPVLADRRLGVDPPHLPGGVQVGTGQHG
jgi:predicted amidohydrolase